MTESFCKLPRPLMAATQWVSLTTGEHLALSGQDKILWVWMKDRYDFFIAQRKDWFDNQDEIAKFTGCSVSTVKRFIGLLSKHGYMKKDSASDAWVCSLQQLHHRSRLDAGACCKS